MSKHIDKKLASKIISASESLKVVLIDRLGQEGLYGPSECARNIYLIDDGDNVIWQVRSGFDSDGGAFTNITFTDGRLQGYRWDGGMYDIDLNTGKAEPGLLLR
ncbi:hypothetical protein [Pseudomonas sp. PMCC200344]|uniref:hypothetical protein n=1 Tax=Pseudomonas sp. PMCC200344 TaxID=3042028 RepID=UPI0024B3BBA0|nr:hypothetical protein [Pseudomonas sp. PMCC200344]